MSISFFKKTLSPAITFYYFARFVSYISFDLNPFTAKKGPVTFLAFVARCRLLPI